MARAALGFSLHQLARISGVSEKTIRRFEAAVGDPPVAESTQIRLRQTFESCGCEFQGSADLSWVAVKVDRKAAKVARANIEPTVNG